LFAEVHESTQALDQAVLQLANKLAASNPEAMQLLKQVAWAGTEHWDELLIERAAMSGQLVLSDFTVNAINQFKAK
jgi:methylglutaconyl-CoA hydratase